MEATAYSKTSVQLYQTARHHKPGDIAIKKKRRIFIAEGLVFCDLSLRHLQNMLFERNSFVRADVAFRPVKHRRSIWLTVPDGHLLAPTESCHSRVTQHTYLLSRRNGIFERHYVKRLLCCYSRVEQTCIAQGLSGKFQTQRWPQSSC